MNTPFVRPDVQALLAMMQMSEQPTIDKMEPAVARQMYVAMRTVIDAEPSALARIEDFSCPGPAGDIPLRLYDPRAERTAPTPLIMFFHGGGFVIGDLETHHPFCSYMAEQMDMPLIAVDYRLAPEAPFPAAPDDCEAATRWIAEKAGSLGYELSGIIPCGDSAGGNLAIVITQALVARPAAAPVIAQLPFYPVTTDDAKGGSMEEFAEGYFLTRETMDYFHAHYAGAADDPRSAPIVGNHRAMPPSIVVTAGLDPLRDQGRDYAAALAQAGNDVTYMEKNGTIHGFICMRKAVPSAQADIDSAFSALRVMLASI